MKQHGEATWSDRESDRSYSIATTQCVHCHRHFPIQPGSGKIRGFCQNCNGGICGPRCAECVPAMQKIENIERGNPLDFRPVIVSASG